jgi:two-component system phosphate regulon sensor histidine kinase PhoR
MEAGRRVYEIRPEDAASIVDEAIAAFEPARERRNVELVIDVPSGLPRVPCDRNAMVDALVNLLSNAYKYGGQPRRIEIAVRADEREVTLTVRDNGKGIARNEHKRIFEKFYRVDDLLAREQDGSGIGLSIVQHVMRAHRGRIDVDSGPGRGSAFTLALKRNPPASLMESIKPPAAEQTGGVA